MRDKIENARGVMHAAGGNYTGFRPLFQIKAMTLSKKQRLLQIQAFFLILPLFSATPALAIQSHGPPEGLYVHLIGHLLYGLAMVGFALRIRISKLAKDTAWRFMAVGAILFACWNAWAIVAHIVAKNISADHFLLNEQGIRTALVMDTPVAWFYYLLKMDHLICVPALLLIYLALRKMNSRSSSIATGNTL